MHAGEDDDDEDEELEHTMSDRRRKVNDCENRLRTYEDTKGLDVGTGSMMNMTGWYDLSASKVGGLHSVVLIN